MAERAPAAIKFNYAEGKVLAYLAERYSEDFGFLCFASIAAETGIDRKIVRRACRSLKRKGLTRFASGLWGECGEPRGSGYAATEAGAEVMRKITCSAPHPEQRTLSQNLIP